MSTPYRADQIGSFLRPAELLEARQATPPDPARVRALEDRHIARVLAKQQELGFEIFTDGELRRKNFMSDFTDAVEGFDFGDAVARMWQAGGTAAPAVSKVTGIVTAQAAPGGAPDRARAAVPQAAQPGRHQDDAPERDPVPGHRVQARASPTRSTRTTRRSSGTSSPSPGARCRRWSPRASSTSRSTPLATATTWTRSGATTSGPRWGSTPTPRSTRRSGRTTPAWKGPRGPGVTLAIHLCRGNNRSHWYAEGGYDPIAEKLFGTLRVDRFLLEYDDERSGTFEPLRFVPRGKTVVLGLVSSKLPALESRPRSHAADRGGGALRAARAPGPLPAVRLRLDDGGQPPLRGRAVGQAAARRGNRPRGLEVDTSGGAAPPFVSLPGAFSRGARTAPPRRGPTAPAAQPRPSPFGEGSGACLRSPDRRRG